MKVINSFPLTWKRWNTQKNKLAQFHNGGWKCTQKQLQYTSLQSLNSPLSLKCLKLMVASCAASPAEKRSRGVLALLKLIAAKWRKHMHWWYSREQDRSWGVGVRWGCWGMSASVLWIFFCFMAVFSEMPLSAVVRARGLGSGPSLSTSCRSTWARWALNLVTTALDKVDFVLPVLFSFSSFFFCSSSTCVYDSALVYKPCSRVTGCWFLPTL